MQIPCEPYELIGSADKPMCNHTRYEKPYRSIKIRYLLLTSSSPDSRPCGYRASTHNAYFTNLDVVHWNIIGSAQLEPLWASTRWVGKQKAPREQGLRQQTLERFPVLPPAILYNWLSRNVQCYATTICTQIELVQAGTPGESSMPFEQLWSTQLTPSSCSALDY